MISLRAILSAGSIEDEGVVGAVRTLGSKEEDVFKGDIAEEGSTNIKIIDEFASWPMSGENYLLVVIIDDKAC